ncbi:MAG: hypothetical protein WC568_05345 [Candidatus Methanoperedens sp.]
MKYQPLLSEVKKFLTDTRIIEWCNGQCKGYCCGNEQSLEGAEFFECQSLDDCDNRLACKIHLCDSLIEYLFYGKDRDDYQRIIRYIDDEINKKLMITTERGIDVYGNSFIKQHHAFHPYNKKMDDIDFNDAKIKSIFKIDRVKIAKKIDILLNFQCSKMDMDDQCLQCTKLVQCSLYIIKKERIKVLTGQKSLYLE